MPGFERPLVEASNDSPLQDARAQVGSAKGASHDIPTAVSRHQLEAVIPNTNSLMSMAPEMGGGAGISISVMVVFLDSFANAADAGRQTGARASAVRASAPRQGQLVKFASARNRASWSTANRLRLRLGVPAWNLT